MELSAVDLSPVPDSGTAADAYANTVEAAQQAERLGFERFWVAEHHGMADTLAGTTPEVLLGHLAAETDSIRLGSSTSSAAIAAEHGLPFCFAAFIRPQFATYAFEDYREQFQPSRLDGGIDEPQGVVAVNAVCAETDQEAARLRAVAEASYRRMQRGVIGTTPSIEEAIDELGGVPEPTPATVPTTKLYSETRLCYSLRNDIGRLQC